MYAASDRQLEDTYNRSLSVETCSGQSYFDLMAEIHFVLDKYQNEIVSSQLADVNELLTQKSNYVWYRILHGSKYYEFPHDLEFATELQPELVHVLLGLIADDAHQMSMRNRRILIELKSIGNKQEEYQDLNIFESVREIENRIQSSIRKAKSFRGGSGELNTLNESFSIPSRTHYSLILTQKILHAKNHPRHADVAYQFKNSYFKGSIDAFDLSLKSLFVALNQGAELLAEKAKAILNDPKGRLKGNQLSQNLYGFSLTNEDTISFDAFHESLDRYWKKLERLPFAKIKKQWRADPYIERFKKMESEAASMQEISELCIEIRDLLHDSSQSEGAVNLNLNIEEYLGLRASEDLKSLRAWIDANRVKLTRVLNKILSSLVDKKPKPRTPMPLALKKLLVQDDQSAKDLSVSIDPAPLRADLELILEEDDDPETLLPKLLGLYERTKVIADAVSFHNLSWFVARSGSFNSRIIKNLITQIFESDHACKELQERITIELEDAYEGLDSFCDAGYEVLEKCVDIVLERRLYKIQTLDMDVLSFPRYKSQLDLANSQPNHEERLLQLYLLYRELDALPSLEALTERVNIWAKELGEARVQEYNEFLKENRPRLEQMANNMTAKMRMILKQGAQGSPRIRMTAFKIWNHAAGHLRQILEPLREACAWTANIRDGHIPARKLTRLRDRIIQSQMLFVPKKDEVADIQRILAPIKISEQQSKQLAIDLSENYRALKELKKETDKVYHQIRATQKKFGREGEVDHLGISLNHDDLQTMKKNYGLKEDIGQEDLQYFGYAHLERGGKLKELLKALEEQRLSGKGPAPPIVFEYFKEGTYANFEKKRICPASIRLILLYFDKKFLQAECNFMVYFLNFVSPGKMARSRSFTNLIALFKLVDQKDRHHKVWLRRLSGKVREAVHAFTPMTQKSNYELNREALFSQMNRVLGDRLDTT